ncbi:MAG: hypothetical protein JWP17_436, partial [Solirubrobacterales bacterium]|nr:hypothetical protein [Solirubrobacterales bacterium]
DRPGPADAVTPSDRPGPAGGQAAFERRAAAARAGDRFDDDETGPRPLAAEALPRLPEIPPTAETEIVDAGADRTVRVLSGHRRPRHRAEDEEEPTRISPTATRVGARSISPAASRTRHRGPQRTVALVALAVAIVAFLLVVVLRVGPI